MIHVRKGPPPAALTTCRATPDTSVDPPQPAHYDGPGFEAVKQDVREALVAEQRGVCCYCNDRIAPTEAGMHIEHRVPQHGEHGDPTRDLDWTNLLAACPGAIPNPLGKGPRVLHCDAAKGHTPMSLDPTQAAHVGCIEYARSGKVTSTRKAHQDELDAVLCLNVKPLVERRQRVLSVFQAELGRRCGARVLPRPMLEKLREQVRDPHGQLRPFAGVLCDWLERALRKAG